MQSQFVKTKPSFKDTTKKMFGCKKEIKLQSKKNRASQKCNTKHKEHVLRKSRSTPLIKVEYIEATRVSKLHSAHPKEYVCTDKVNKGHRIKKVEKLSDCRYVKEGHYLDRKVFHKMYIEMQSEEYAKNYFENRRNGTSIHQQLITCQIKKHHESIKKTNRKIERHTALSNPMNCNVTEAYFMLTNRDDIDQERSKNRKEYPRMNTVQVASSFDPEFNIGKPQPEMMMKADEDLKGDSFFKCCNFYFCQHEWNKKERQSKIKPTKIIETSEQTKKDDTNFKKNHLRKCQLVNKNVKIPNVPDDSTLKCESQQNKNSLLHRCFRLISRKDKQKPLKGKVMNVYNEKEKIKTGTKKKIIKLCFTFRTGKKDRIKLKKSKSVIPLSQTQEQKKASSIKRPTLQRPTSTNLVKSQSHTSSVNIYTANCNEKITAKSTSRTTVINVDKLLKNGTLSETFQVRSGLKFEVRPSKPQVGRVSSSLKLILKFKKNILSFFSRKRKKETKENKYVDKTAKTAENVKKRKGNCIKMLSKSAIQKKSSNENQNNFNQILGDSKINTSRRQIDRTDSKTNRTKSQTDSTYKRESRPFEYDSRLSIPRICDPHDCSNRIESKELYVLTSTNSQNKGSESQTDVIKTDSKAIQAQTVSLSNDNTSVISKRHFRTTHRQRHISKKARHDITNSNTKCKYKPFECKLGFCVSRICDPCDCLNIIESNELYVLTSLNKQNKESERQTDVIKTGSKAIPNQTDRRNNRNTRFFSKRRSSIMHRQTKKSKKGRHDITNLNFKHKRKIRLFECEPEFCIPGICNPYDCSKRTESKELYVLLSMNSQNKDNESEIDVTKTYRKATQTDRRNNKNTGIISKREFNTTHKHLNRNKNVRYEFECMPGYCVLGICDLYDRLKRIKSKELYVLTSIKSQNKRNDSQTDVIKTDSKVIQTQTEGRNNNIISIIFEKHLSVTHRELKKRKMARHDITNLNTKYKRKRKRFKGEPEFCIPGICNPYSCSKRTESKELYVLPLVNSQNESQTDVMKTDSKAIQTQTEGRNNENTGIISKSRLNIIYKQQHKNENVRHDILNIKHKRKVKPFECVPEYCVPGICDPYYYFKRIESEVYILTSTKSQNKGNKSQTDVIKTDSKAIQTRNVRTSNEIPSIISKRRLSKTHRQPKKSKKCRHDITNLNTTHKRKPRPFKCDARLCVSGMCDPNDCFKRIESKELYKLTSVNGQNKVSKSQTDVIKTDSKAIQTETNRKNYKNTSIIFERHLITTCRLLNKNKNVRHDITNLNTKHERTLKSFECDTGHCVPGIRDPYICLKISKKESWELTSIKSKTKERESQTDVIKTKRKAMQNETDERNNNYAKTVSNQTNRMKVPKGHLSLRRIQKSRSKKAQRDITNLNKKYKKNVRHFKCGPELCVPEKYDPFNCSMKMNTKESHVLSSIRSTKNEETQTDIFKTKRNANQCRIDIKKIKYKKNISKLPNRKNVSKRHLNKTHRQTYTKKSRNAGTNYKTKTQQNFILKLSEIEVNMSALQKRKYTCVNNQNNDTFALAPIGYKTKESQINVIKLKKNKTEGQASVDNKRNEINEIKTEIMHTASHTDIGNSRSSETHVKQTISINFPEKFCETNEDRTKTKLTRNDIGDLKSKMKGKKNQTFVIKTKEGKTQANVICTSRNKTLPKFVIRKNICMKQLRKTYMSQKNIKNSRNDGTKTQTNENKKQVDAITTEQQSVQIIISKKELHEEQRPQIKISQTNINKIKNAKRSPEFSSRNTNFTKHLRKTYNTQNNKEKRRNNVKIVKDRNILNLKLKTNVRQPNFCIPNGCDSCTSSQIMVHNTTNTCTPNTLKKSLGNIQTETRVRKSQTDVNIIKDAKSYPKESAEKYVSKKQLSKIQILESNMDRHRECNKQPVILKIKPNVCEPGLCIPALCDPFTGYERNPKRKTRSTSKSDIRKIQSQANVTMTTAKATKSQTYIKSIQNTNTRPKQSSRAIASNNKINTEYRLQINGSNRNDVPNFKDQCRIRTVEKKSQIDTRTYPKLKPNTINSHNDITNLKTNIMLKQQPHKCKLKFTAPKQWSIRAGIQKSNSDCGRKKIKTIKTSESDNCHYTVVPSRGHKKNLILKPCLEYGIMHKKKHVDISSQTNEISQCSQYDNNNITHNNNNKKSKSDNDFMWAQKAKKEPSTVISKYKKTHTNTQKPNIISSTVKREQTNIHSPNKQKSNSTNTTFVYGEKLSKNFKPNGIFRVGSSFKFGIKFFEPQTVGVGTNSKLSFKFNRNILPCFICDKKKTEAIRSTGSYKKNDIEVPSKQLIKIKSSKKTQDIYAPNEQKQNNMRNSYKSTQSKNINNIQTKFHQNKPKNKKKIHEPNQMDIKIPKHKKMSIRNQIGTPQSFEPGQNRDNKCKSRIENLKKSKEEFRKQKSYENRGSDNSLSRKKKIHGSQSSLCKRLSGSCDRCNTLKRVQRKQGLSNKKSYDCQTHICETSTKQRNPLMCLKNFFCTNAYVKHYSKTSIPKETTKIQYKQIVRSGEINNTKKDKSMKSILISRYECHSSYCLQKRCSSNKYLQETDTRSICVTYSSFSKNHQIHVLKYNNKVVQVMTLILSECEPQFSMSKRCEPYKYFKGNHNAYADTSSPNKSKIFTKKINYLSLTTKNKSITILKPYKCKLDTCMIKQYNSYELLKRIKRIDSITSSIQNIHRNVTCRKRKSKPNRLKKISTKQSIHQNKTKNQPNDKSIIPHKNIRRSCTVMTRSESKVSKINNKKVLHKSSRPHKNKRSNLALKQNYTKKLLPKTKEHEIRKGRNRLPQSKSKNYQIKKLKSYKCETEFGIQNECNLYKWIKKRVTYSSTKFPKSNTPACKANYKICKTKQTQDILKPHECDTYFCVLEKCSPFEYQKQKGKRNKDTHFRFKSKHTINKKSR